MSKDQKKTIEIPVETVDNWKRAVESIASSIRFWFPNEEKEWPFNFFIDNLYLLKEEIGKNLMPF